jgi:hypothetical protein
MLLSIDNSFFDIAIDEMQHEMGILETRKTTVSLDAEKDEIKIGIGITEISKSTSVPSASKKSAKGDEKHKAEPYIPYQVVYLDDSDEKGIKLSNRNISNEIAAILKLIKEAERLCNNDRSLEDKVVQFTAECLDQVWFLFKSSAYSHEKEYRFVKLVSIDSERIKITQDPEKYVVPQLYIEREDEQPIKFARIILGPKVSQFNDIIPYIKYVDKNITVSKSKVKFR